MSMLELGETRLRYETSGDGPPVLCLAPGGLRGSRIETWDVAPWNPIEALRADHRVVAMDQRNTGTSWAPVTAADSWASYADDQLALMDHLGIDRFAVVGMCIGGSFIVELLKRVPERVTAAVAFQPIGLADNRNSFCGMFDAWRDEHAAAHSEASPDDWESVWEHMFGGDDMLWSATDEELARIETPLLVLAGADEFHPTAASNHLAELAPNATLIEHWKEGADVESAKDAVLCFLRQHAATA